MKKMYFNYKSNLLIWWKRDDFLVVEKCRTPFIRIRNKNNFSWTSLFVSIALSFDIRITMQIKFDHSINNRKNIPTHTVLQWSKSKRVNQFQLQHFLFLLNICKCFKVQGTDIIRTSVICHCNYSNWETRFSHEKLILTSAIIQWRWKKKKTLKIDKRFSFFFICIMALCSSKCFQNVDRGQ